MTMLFYFKPSPSSMIPSGVPNWDNEMQIKKLDLVRKRKKKLEEEDQLILSFLKLLEEEDE